MYRLALPLLWASVFPMFTTLFRSVGADQVIRLERPGILNGPGDIIYEPLFNPKSIYATVGEKIHFQAVFQNVSALPVALSIDIIVLINREERLYPSYGLLVNLHTLRLAYSVQMVLSSSLASF
jgi:hypothetical protein